MLIVSILFSSCEKAIDVHLKQTSNQLVVDASIENNKPPIVYLSHSLDYYSEISLDVLAASFIHNAIVTITTGNNSYQLKEASTMADTSGNLIYYYTTDSVGSGALLGSLNTSYSLKIEVDSQVYTSQTTIPPLAKKIDSLWWKPAPNNPDTTLVVLVAKVTDPPGYGNYIRYFTSQNSGPFLPGLNSVFDDQIVDGTTYNIDVDRGVNRNLKIDFNTYAFFQRGDSVVVKFCNIDKGTYDFWRTMEYNYQSIGNPFSSPTTVLGNISNNALGYFGGYAAQYISLKIPE
ncbi:MAG TPA: DUF4249 domain-containing protein [Puia sp.]|nr:DUF4249 domain-containing protein [Puia sp.]